MRIEGTRDSIASNQPRVDSSTPLHSNREVEDEMKIDGLTIDIESTQFARKLRVVAKHAEQLADELDAIDNAWECNCGSTEYIDVHADAKLIRRKCGKCGECYAISQDDGLPTRLESSE